MSQNFKLKFDEMQESNPATTSENNTSENDLYDTPGHVRNLCFVWPDGRMKFLNYAYLISGDYMSAEEDSIVLFFSTYTVIIKGLQLSILYEFIQAHLAKIISFNNTRYSEISDDTRYIVNFIEVLKTS